MWSCDLETNKSDNFINFGNESSCFAFEHVIGYMTLWWLMFIHSLVKYTLETCI